MAKPTVHLLSLFTINEGQFDAFQSVANELIAATRGEAATLGYEWFLSSDGKRCRLLESFTDAKALAAHLNGPALKLLPKFLQYVTSQSFEVLGEPDSETAAMLANFGAQGYKHWAGL